MAEEGQSGASPDRGRDETDKERADRNLNELLGELRVALPGVQVLFAFLLTVPFSQRFAEVNAFSAQRLLRHPAVLGRCLGPADRPHGAAPHQLRPGRQGAHRRGG